MSIFVVLYDFLFNFSINIIIFIQRKKYFFVPDIILQINISVFMIQRLIIFLDIEDIVC